MGNVSSQGSAMVHRNVLFFARFAAWRNAFCWALSLTLDTECSVSTSMIFLCLSTASSNKHRKRCGVLCTTSHRLDRLLLSSAQHRHFSIEFRPARGYFHAWITEGNDWMLRDMCRNYCHSALNPMVIGSGKSFTIRTVSTLTCTIRRMAVIRSRGSSNQPLGSLTMLLLPSCLTL